MRRLVRRIFGSEHDERPSEATGGAALSGTTHSSRAAYPPTLTSSSALLKSGNRSYDDDDDDDGYESPGVLDAATLSELTSQAFAFHNSTVTTGDATATMVVVPARRTTHDGEEERRAGAGWRNADEPGAVDAAAPSSPTNSSPVAPHDDADDAVDDFLQNVIAGKTDVLRKQLAQQKLDAAAAAAAAAAGPTRHGSPTSAAPPGSGFRGSMTRDSASMAADGKEPHTTQENSAVHQQQHRRKYVSSAARSLQDYELIAFLGSGTFAEVTLARNKVTQEYFAVKKISKQRVKEEGCVERTFTERQLLANLHHPFLVRLYQAFQSQTHLYLVLDFAQGGDLFYVNMQQLWLRQMKRGLVKMQYPYYQSTSSTFTAPASATGTATTPPTAAAATAVPFASTPPPRPPPLLNASYGYSHSHSPQRDHQHLHTHHHLHHYDSHHRQASQDSVASLTTAVTPTSTNSGTTTAASDCVGVGVAASSSPPLLARPPLPPAAQETSTASVRVAAAPAPPSAHKATASNTQTASSGVGCAVAASTGSAFTTTQTATGAVLRGGGRGGVGRHSDKNIDMLAHYRSGRTSRQHHHHANDDDDDDDYGNDDEGGEGDDDDDDDGNNEGVEVTAALGLDGAEVTSSSAADGSGSGLPQPVVSSSSSSPQQQQASHPKRKPRKYLYYTTDAVDEFTSTPHTTGLLPPASLLASGAVREPLRLETGRDDSMIEEEDDHHGDDDDDGAHPHRSQRALHIASSSGPTRTEKEKERRSDAAHDDGDHGVPPIAGDGDATSALSQRCHSTRSSSEGGQRGGEDASASAAAAAAVAATRPQSSRDTATTAAAAATAFSSSNSPPGKPRYHLRRTRRSSRQSGNSGSGGAFAGAFSHSFDCIRNNDDDEDDDDADLETEEGEPFNTSRSSGCDNTDGTPHSRGTAPPRRPRRRSSQLTRDSAHTLTSPDAPSRLPPSLAHPSASSSAAAHAAAAGRQRRSTLSTGRGGHESKAESSRTRRSASLSSMAASPADATTAAGTPNITSTPLGEGFWGMAGDGESPVPTGSMHSVSAVDAGGSGGVVAEASASRGEEVAGAPAVSSGFATSSFTVTTTAGAAAAAVAMVTVPSATAPPHAMGHHHSNGGDDTAEGTADRKRKAKKNRKGSATPAAAAAEDMSSFSDATTAASAAAAAVASGKSKKKKKHHGDHESRGQSVNVSCLSTPLTTLTPTPKPPPPPSATDRNKEEGEEDDREHHDDDGADTETHSTRHDKKKKKKDKTTKKKKHSHHHHNHDSKTSGNTTTAPTPFAVDAPLANATPAPPQTPTDNASEHTSNGAAAAAAAAGRFSAAPEVVAAARGIAYPSRSPGGATPAQEAAANAAAAHVDLAAPFRQVGMEQSQTPLRDLPPSKFAPDDTHRFPLKLIAFYAVEVALVLQYLHGEGFLYRDLKPENILMRGDGHVMLTDFGVAKYRKGAAIATSAGLSSNNNNSSGGAKEHDAGGALGAKADDSGNPAATTAADGKANSFTGTTQYMSPEMLRGLPHDSRTDWWSYGCLLFEWANGRKAFDGANQFSLFRSIVEEDVKVTPNDYRLTPLEVHTRVAQLHYRSEELRLEYEERAARRLRRSGGLGTSLQTSMVGGGAAAAAATSSPPVTAEVVYNRENRSFDIRLLTPPVAGAAANTSDPSDPTAAAVDSAATTPHPGSCRTASNVSFVPSPAATPHPPAVMSPATQLPPAVPPDALSGSLTVSNGSGMTMMQQQQQQQYTMSNLHSSSHRHHYQRPSDRSFAGQYANNNSSSNAVAAGAVAALLNDSFAVQQQQYDPHRSGSAVTSTTTTHQQQPPPPPTNLSVVNDSFANASFASVQHNSVFSVAGTPNNLSLRLTTTEDGGIAALVSSNASPTALRQQQQQQERMRRNRRRRARLSCLAIDPATRDRYLDDALQQMEEAQELLRDLTLKLLDRSVDTRLCGEAVLEHPFFTCSYVVSQLYYRVYQQRLLPRELRRSAKLGMTGLGSCPSFTDLTASLRDDGLPGGGGAGGGTSPSSNSFALPGGGFSGAGNTNNNSSLCQYPGSMFGSFIALPSQRRPDDWRELFLNRSIRAVYTPRLRTRDDLRYFPAAVTATGLSAAVEQHRRIKEVKEQQKELLRATKATMMMMNNNTNNNNSITSNNNNNAATSTTGGSNVNNVEGVGSDSLAGTLTAADGVVVVPLDEAAAQQMQQILANSSTSGSINININGRSTTTSNNASGVFSVRADGPAHDDGFSHSPSPVPPPPAAAAAGNETVVPALESSQRRHAAGGEGHAMESATAQPELQLASPLGPASASAAAAMMTMNDTVTAGATREAGGVDPFASPVSDSAVHPLTEQPSIGEHASHPAVTAAAARVQVVEDLSSVLPAAVSRDVPQPLTPTIVVTAASTPPPPPLPLPSSLAPPPAAAAAAHEGSTEAASTSTAVLSLQPHVHDEGQAVRDAPSSSSGSGTTGDVGDNSKNKKKCADSDDMHYAGGGKGDVGEKNADEEQHDPHHQRLSHPPGGAVVTLVNTVHSAPTTPALSLANIGDEADSAAFSTPAAVAARGRSSPTSAAVTVSEAVSTEKDTYAVTAGTSLLSSSLASSLLPPRPRPPHPHSGDYLVSSGGHRNEMESEGGTAVSDVASPLSMMAGGTDNSMDNASRASLTSSSQLFDRAATLPQSFVDAALAVAAAAAHKKQQQQQHLHQTQQQQQHALTPGSSFASFAHTDGGFSHGAATAPSSPLLMRRSSTVPMQGDDGADEGKQQQQQERNRAASLASGGQPTTTAAAAGGGGAEIDTRGTTAPVNVVHAGESMQGLAGAATAPSAGAERGENHHATTVRDAMLAADDGGGGEAGEKPALTTRHRQVNAVDDDHTPAANTRLTIAIASGVVDRASEEVANRMALDDNGSEMHEMDDDGDDDAIAAGGGGYYEQDAFEEQRADDDDDMDDAARVSDDRAEHDHDKSDPLHQHSSRGRALQESGLTPAIADDTASIATTTTTTAPTTAETSVSQGHLTPQRPLPGDASLLSPDTSHDRDRHHRANPLAPGSDLSYDDSSLSGSVRSSITTSTLFTDARGDAGVSSNSPGSSSGDNSGLRRPALPFVVPVTALPVRSAEAADTIASTVAPQSHTNGPADPHSCHDTPGAAHEEGDSGIVEHLQSAMVERVGAENSEGSAPTASTTATTAVAAAATEATNAFSSSSSSRSSSPAGLMPLRGQLATPPAHGSYGAPQRVAPSPSSAAAAAEEEEEAATSSPLPLRVRPASADVTDDNGDSTTTAGSPTTEDALAATQALQRESSPDTFDNNSPRAGDGKQQKEGAPEGSAAGVVSRGVPPSALPPSDSPLHANAVSSSSDGAESSDDEGGDADERGYETSDAEDDSDSDDDDDDGTSGSSEEGSDGSETAEESEEEESEEERGPAATPRRHTAAFSQLATPAPQPTSAAVEPHNGSMNISNSTHHHHHDPLPSRHGRGGSNDVYVASSPSSTATSSSSSSSLLGSLDSTPTTSSSNSLHSSGSSGSLSSSTSSSPLSPLSPAVGSNINSSIAEYGKRSASNRNATANSVEDDGEQLVAAAVAAGRGVGGGDGGPAYAYLGSPGSDRPRSLDADAGRLAALSTPEETNNSSTQRNLYDDNAAAAATAAAMRETGMRGSDDDRFAGSRHALPSPIPVVMAAYAASSSAASSQVGMSGLAAGGRPDEGRAVFNVPETPLGARQQQPRHRRKGGKSAHLSSSQHAPLSSPVSGNSSSVVVGGSGSNMSGVGGAPLWTSHGSLGDTRFFAETTMSDLSSRPEFLGPLTTTLPGVAYNLDEEMGSVSSSVAGTPLSGPTPPPSGQNNFAAKNTFGVTQTSTIGNSSTTTGRGGGGGGAGSVKSLWAQQQRKKVERELQAAQQQQQQAGGAALSAPGGSGGRQGSPLPPPVAVSDGLRGFGASRQQQQQQALEQSTMGAYRSTGTPPAAAAAESGGRTTFTASPIFPEQTGLSSRFGGGGGSGGGSGDPSSSRGTDDFFGFTFNDRGGAVASMLQGRNRAAASDSFDPFHANGDRNAIPINPRQPRFSSSSNTNNSDSGDAVEHYSPASGRTQQGAWYHQGYAPQSPSGPAMLPQPSLTTHPASAHHDHGGNGNSYSGSGEEEGEDGGQHPAGMPHRSSDANLSGSGVSGSLGGFASFGDSSAGHHSSGSGGGGGLDHFQNFSFTSPQILQQYLASTKGGAGGGGQPPYGQKPRRTHMGGGGLGNN